MYQNQLFFEDFQKVFKVRIAEQEELKKTGVQTEKKQAIQPSHTIGDIWVKRLIIKLGLQSMLH